MEGTTPVTSNATSNSALAESVPAMGSASIKPDPAISVAQSADRDTFSRSLDAESDEGYKQVSSRETPSHEEKSEYETSVEEKAKAQAKELEDAFSKQFSKVVVSFSVGTEGLSFEVLDLESGTLIRRFPPDRMPQIIELARSGSSGMLVDSMA